MSDFPEEKATTGDENLGLIGPDSFLFGTMPHYHGDIVRQLMVSAAALIILGIPLFSNLSIFKTPAELVGALLLIFFAGMTTPLRLFPLIGDAFLCAVGLVVYEPLAISAYHSGELVLFVVYEALSILFLFSVYFSVKSIRGLLSKHQAPIVHKDELELRSDGEEYTGPPVSIAEEQVEVKRGDSRPGDMKEFGRYDD